MATDKELEAIEVLLANYSRGLNAGSADLVAGLYADKGAFMPEASATIVGRQNIHRSAECFFKNYTFQISFSVKNVRFAEGFAFVQGVSDTSCEDRLGMVSSGKNRDFFVLEKQSGNWKIVTYMFNNFGIKGL